MHLHNMITKKNKSPFIIIITPLPLQLQAHIKEKGGPEAMHLRFTQTVMPNFDVRSFKFTKDCDADSIESFKSVEGTDNDNDDDDDDDENLVEAEEVKLLLAIAFEI